MHGTALAEAMNVRAVLLLSLVAACVDLSSNENNAADSYEGVEITGDVAPSEGRETVRATIAEVTVRDARGALIASIPAYEPQGSRDEVLGIRISEGYVGAPLIAVTTTIGGHRESTTYVALYSVHDKQVERMFGGAIEVAEDESVAAGTLLVFPGALLYRAPRAEQPTLYGYDASTHRYVVR
jgi:hypothetical protein